VRLDSAIYTGYAIPPYYDSLIGKLIVHGRDRAECIARLKRCLGEMVVGGIETTIPLFQDLLVRQPDILAGDYDIHWLERWIKAAESLTEPGFSAIPSAPSRSTICIACYASRRLPDGGRARRPSIFLIEPEQRGVLPLDGFHIPTRLAHGARRSVRGAHRHRLRQRVLEACAAPAPGREDTWINGPIRRLYLALMAMGHAQSIECWKDERLVGGLYGVTLGGAFFGESMFSRERDASKVALVHLVARLKRGGWRLLDAQFLTEHLSQFGAVEPLIAGVEANIQPWKI
jgi:leucyl/phenylalanyl-tRNA--protein transferase